MNDRWEEIGRQLHEEWESPELWGRIEAEIAQARRPAPLRWALAAAAVIVLAALLSLGVPRSFTAAAPDGWYREKLLLLDSGIEDLQAEAAGNHNDYLQAQLAELYREKQNTLEDWNLHARRNPDTGSLDSRAGLRAR
jgi:hypothetical protein